MSKADRRKRAGRKLKQDQARQPNGEPSRSPAAERMAKFVEAARARKSRITGRDDLPVDVLGILFGHRRISDAEYNIGRKLEMLMNRIYGSPNEGPSAMFKEAISPPNAEDAERSMEPMSDEAAEAQLLKMDATLRRCGLAVRDLTISAVRYCRYPSSDNQVVLIAQGLAALAKGHAPKSEHRRLVVHKAA